MEGFVWISNGFFWTKYSVWIPQHINPYDTAPIPYVDRTVDESKLTENLPIQVENGSEVEIPRKVAHKTETSGRISLKSRRKISRSSNRKTKNQNVWRNVPSNIGNQMLSFLLNPKKTGDLAKSLLKTAG